MKDFENAEIRKIKHQLLTIEFAMHMARSDGTLRHEELAVITEWMTQKMEYWNQHIDVKTSMTNTSAKTAEKRKETIKKILNRTLRENHRKTASSVNYDELRRASTIAERYETTTLCLKVLAADGFEDKAETRVVEKMAEKLNLDRAFIERGKKKIFSNQAKEKSSKIEEKQKEIKSWMEKVGMPEGMNKKQILDWLQEKFRIQNSRTNNQDHDKRRKAQKMLDYLGKLWKHCQNE